VSLLEFAWQPLVVSLKDNTASDLGRLFAEHLRASCALAEDDGKLTGFITRNDALSHPDGATKLADLVRQDYVAVTPDTATFEVVARLRDSSAFVVLVTDNPAALRADCVKGVITRWHLGEVLVDAAELYLD
jgi:predicted transcriptional regulator